MTVAINLRSYKQEKKRDKKDMYVPEHTSQLVNDSNKTFTIELPNDKDINLKLLELFFIKPVKCIRNMQLLHFEKEKTLPIILQKNC